MVNDGQANSKMVYITSTTIGLYATKHIKANDEIVYKYTESNDGMPWRTVCFVIFTQLSMVEPMSYSSS
jgi:hypothetical protein